MSNEEHSEFSKRFRREPSERDILTEKYRNKTIEALNGVDDVWFKCQTSLDGLPLSFLEPGVGFPLPPKVVMRITGGPTLKMIEFLSKAVGFEEGVDYENHGNGMRMGTRYFDFTDTSAIEKLEAYSKSLGRDPDAPIPWVRIVRPEVSIEDLKPTDTSLWGALKMMLTPTPKSRTK